MQKFKDVEQAFFNCQDKGCASSLVRAYTGNEALVSLHNTQGIYLEISDSSKDIMGLTEAELIGTSAYDYFHPDDFQNVLKSHARITIRPDVGQVSYRLYNGANGYIKVDTLSKKVSSKSGEEFILAFTFKRE